MGNIKCYHKTVYSLFIQTDINKQRKQTVVKIHGNL